MNQPPSGPRLLPVIIGIIITIVLLSGLAYISNMRRNAPTAAPQLTIRSPAEAAVTDSPLVIRFSSERELTLGHSGWASGTYHLHAHVNGVEHMPAARDIVRTGDEYAWTISGAPRGRAVIRLGWADHAHRAVSSGATDSIRITIK
jgi:hypothetical protein